MALSVRPIDGPLGAEILGLETATSLTDGDFRTIERALLDHVGIVACGLEENVDWLLDFGRRFGPLVPHILDQYHHPKTPEMSIITANMGNTESRTTGKPAGAFWHSDLSYDADPSDAIFLYSTTIPNDGGDTLVANMYLAYDQLPERTKRRIEGLTAIHRYGFRGGGAITALAPAQRAAHPDVEHPVVRVHPKTGRQVLFVNPGYTMRIKGMEPAESDGLLTELFAHSLDPAFQYRPKWQRGQLLGLDNRASMHCAVADYREPRRLLRMIVGCTETLPASV